MDQKMYDKGLEIRTAVMGKAYVDKRIRRERGRLRQAGAGIRHRIRLGRGVGREGLTRKTRSMLNLAMLSILNRQHELRGHIRGALNNGVTTGRDPRDLHARRRLRRRARDARLGRGSRRRSLAEIEKE